MYVRPIYDQNLLLLADTALASSTHLAEHAAHVTHHCCKVVHPTCRRSHPLVIQAVLRWVEADPEGRTQEEVQQLLGAVRLPHPALAAGIAAATHAPARPSPCFCVTCPVS